MPNKSKQKQRKNGRRPIQAFFVPSPDKETADQKVLAIYDYYKDQEGQTPKQIIGNAILLLGDSEYPGVIDSLENRPVEITRSIEDSSIRLRDGVNKLLDAIALIGDGQLMSTARTTSVRGALSEVTEAAREFTLIQKSIANQFQGSTDMFEDDE